MGIYPYTLHSLLATTISLSGFTIALYLSWKLPASFISPSLDHAKMPIELNNYLIKNKDTMHLFIIKGDVMIVAGILPEVTLLFDQSMKERSNHITLARVNNYYTVNRYNKSGC